MKLAILFAVGLALAGVTLAAAPVASAGPCPDPDNPCTPEPIDPLECHPNVKPTWDPLGWLGCRI